MPLSASCPHCGNSLKAPDRLAGKQIKCLKCKTSFNLPGAGATEARSDGTPGGPVPAESARKPVTGAVRAAFWLGLAALALGLAAGFCGLFPSTVGYSRTMAWLGIVLGGGAVVLAIVREESGFSFPFAGSAASLLSLALVAFWLGAAPGPDEGRGGRPPGGVGQGRPPDFKGGPPPDRKGGPPPDRKGRPRGDQGKGGPPPPAPQE
jgi:hypothetical protein